MITNKPATPADHNASRPTPKPPGFGPPPGFKSKPGQRPEPEPAEPSADELAEKNERDARIVKELFIPSALHEMLGAEKLGVGPMGMKVYVEKFTAGSKDPIEAMLREEFLFVHHRLAQLHLDARNATSAETAKIYSMAAARLQGENRRLAQTIKAYREPSPQRNFSVITQQNVVASGHQSVQFVEGSDGKESLLARDELKGNPLERRNNAAFATTTSEESAAGGSRADQRRQAPALVE